MSVHNYDTLSGDGDKSKMFKFNPSTQTISITDPECGYSVRSNSEVVNVSPDLPTETSPLLPEEHSRSPRLRMSWVLGTKREASYSPAPLSRRAPAPPPSPHEHMFDSATCGTSEIHETAPSTTSTKPPEPPSPSQPKPPLWKHRPLMHSPSLTLENCGSVARDHLASERTFLAYVRTSLAIASTGVGECELLSNLQIVQVGCSNMII
jgi:Domain of unknown function (DUF202)